MDTQLREEKIFANGQKAWTQGKCRLQWARKVINFAKSSCVKGRKLSALVYSESSDLADEMDDGIEVEATELGHNNGKAQIVSVKCD